MKTKLVTLAAAALALGTAFASTTASAYTENPILKGGYYGSYGGYHHHHRRCFRVYTYDYRWVEGPYGWYKKAFKVFVGYRCRHRYYDVD